MFSGAVWGDSRASQETLQPLSRNWGRIHALVRGDVITVEPLGIPRPTLSFGMAEIKKIQDVFAVLFSNIATQPANTIIYVVGGPSAAKVSPFVHSKWLSPGQRRGIRRLLSGVIKTCSGFVLNVSRNDGRGTLMKVKCRRWCFGNKPRCWKRLIDVKMAIGYESKRRGSPCPSRIVGGLKKHSGMKNAAIDSPQTSPKTITKNMPMSRMTDTFRLHEKRPKWETSRKTIPSVGVAGCSMCSVLSF